jgi:hypothetical protein
MPALAALTVKKYDGTTDVVWAGVTPNGGDGSFSIHRSDAAHAAVPIGQRPRLLASNRTSQAGRVTQYDGVFPTLYTDTTTGLPLMKKGVTMKVIVTVDPSAPVATQQEGVYQLLNLVATALLKQNAYEGSGLT